MTLIKLHFTFCACPILKSVVTTTLINCWVILPWHIFSTMCKNVSNFAYKDNDVLSTVYHLMFFCSWVMTQATGLHSVFFLNRRHLPAFSTILCFCDPRSFDDLWPFCLLAFLPSCLLSTPLLFLATASWVWERTNCYNMSKSMFSIMWCCYSNDVSFHSEKWLDWWHSFMSYM